MTTWAHKGRPQTFKGVICKIQLVESWTVFVTGVDIL